MIKKTQIIFSKKKKLKDYINNIIKDKGLIYEYFEQSNHL